MSGDDLNQLVEFILERSNDTSELHPDLNMPLNETVKIAVHGLLDRLRCTQQGLTHLQCVQCLHPSMILNMLGQEAPSVVTNRLDLEQLSVVLLNHVLHLRNVCQSARIERCRTYSECRKQLAQRLVLPQQGNHSTTKLLENLESVLREIKAFYDPHPGQRCFSAENILAEVAKQSVDGSHHLEEMTSLLVAHILNGDCIDVGEAVTDFIEDIFLHYGDRCNRVITQIGFEKLMKDLRSQDHDDHDDHSVSNYPCSSSSPNKLITMTEIGGISKEVLENNLYMTQPGNKRTSRSTRSDPKTHEHRSLASECLSADGLLRKFLKPSQTISPVQFLQLCPALVQQVVSGVCNFESNGRVEIQTTTLTNSEIYGYSSLAVFVISLLSLCGVCLYPFLNNVRHNYIEMGLIGLSFGTMAGDALLHLIPQALGLHTHEEETSDVHDELSFTNIPRYIWYQLGLLAAIYLMYLFESIFTIASKDDSENKQGICQSTGSPSVTMSMEDLETKSTAVNILGKSISTTAIVTADEPPVKFKPAEPIIKSPHVIWGFSSKALVLVFGDILHNFGDGIAIGASFAPGIRGGVSTSLAVFCHEVPHEFGDFVFLISAGLPFRKAIFANFVSALFSFVGLYVGIYLGEDNTTRTWILTATAGIFLYSSLTDMLPDLKAKNLNNIWTTLFVKNIGILSGISIMIIIAIFEDHFHF